MLLVTGATGNVGRLVVDHLELEAVGGDETVDHEGSLLITPP